MSSLPTTFKTALSGIAFAIVMGSSSVNGSIAVAGEQPTCPLQLTTDDGRCAFHVTSYIMQTTFNSIDLFDLPTAVLVTGMEIIGMPVGAYHDEARGGSRFFPAPAEGYETIKTYRFISSGGPSADSWTTLPDGSTVYRYSIKLKRAWWRGNERRWFKGHVSRVDALVGYPVRQEELRAIEDALNADALAALAAEAAAHRAAQARNRTKSGGSSRLCRFCY